MTDNIIKIEDRIEFDSLKEEYENQQMPDEQFAKLKLRMEEAKRDNRKMEKKVTYLRIATCVASVAIIFVMLPNLSPSIAYAMEQIPFLGKVVDVVTFRNYEFESDKNMANVVVPKIQLDEQLEDSETTKQLEYTADEINVEIQKITEELIENFKKHVEEDLGYEEIIVTSNVLETTPDYFTLKLFCYQIDGSGYQWNYYFTIDLNTGERVKLQDIFQEGADYITPISRNIKEQMQEQMAQDEMIRYWINQECEEWNFETITDETAFYLNEKGNVVICFNEGDVAPMYMGAVEFEIPAEILENIRK